MVILKRILNFQTTPQKEPGDSATKLTRLNKKYYNRVSGGDYGLTKPSAGRRKQRSVLINAF
jgi:hypothetical protein